MANKDYYTILGVPKTATQDEIKKAYRKLARKYHPDVSTAPDAEQRIKEINEAYDCLGNPDKRKSYDQFGGNPNMYGANRQQQQYQGQYYQGAQFTNMNDMFEQMFRAQAEQQARQQQARQQQYRNLPFYVKAIYFVFRAIMVLLFIRFWFWWLF